MTSDDDEPVHLFAPELVLAIAEYADDRTFCRMARTCRLWRALLKTDKRKAAAPREFRMHATPTPWTFHIYPNGRKHGLEKFSIGKLLYRMHWSEGKLDGPAGSCEIPWNRIEEECWFDRGLLHGTHVEYSAGNLSRTTDYEQGLAHGRQYCYNDRSDDPWEIRYRRDWHRGRLHGREEHYVAGGRKPVFRKRWHHGLAHGAEKWSRANGVVASVRYFHHGRQLVSLEQGPKPSSSLRVRYSSEVLLDRSDSKRRCRRHQSELETDANAISTNKTAFLTRITALSGQVDRGTYCWQT